MRDIIESSGLTAKEESVVRLHYGIDCQSHSLEEIATIFDLPEEIIRRIEADALRKLRLHWFARHQQAESADLVENLMAAAAEEPWMAFTEAPVQWELTEADRSFLRSCNICPA